LSYLPVAAHAVDNDDCPGENITGQTELCIIIHQLKQDVLFAPEVMIKGSLVHAEFPGNLPHGHGMIALIGKKAGYNTLNLMAFLEILWAGHIQV